jgi:hypothetical protein
MTDEIDIKIAELKGWTGIAPATHNNPAWGLMPGCTKHREGAPIPRWSTDIAAAWGLVEEVMSAGVGYDLANVRHSNGNMTHEFILYDPIGGPNSKRYPAEENTAPLAICAAWLKWMEARQ